MSIAVFVGLISGIVGTMCWVVIQLILNMPEVNGNLGTNWCFAPLLIGAVAAVMHSLGRGLGGNEQDSSVRRHALSDLIESYLFGVFILSPFKWFARGVVSLCNAFLGGTFGLEGGVLELSFSTLPVLSKYFRLFMDEKQSFVICTIAASFSVALAAPFSGALIAIELVHVLNAKVRKGAVVSALMAYGTAMVFQSTLLSNFFVEGSLERLNILSSLFTGLRPLNIESSQWALLGLAAVCIGMGTALVSSVTSKLLTRGRIFVSENFANRTEFIMIATGALIAITVYLNPNSFNEPWKTWEELAWVRLSVPSAALLLVTEWTLLILAFSGWGSSGLISPILLIGALFGYSVGNIIGASWAVPLAIAGATSMLSATFRIPVAACAFVLEIGHDGPMWCLSTLAVVASSIVIRHLKVKPVHELLLESQGIRIVSGRAASLLTNLKARDAMFQDIQKISENSSFQELRAAAAAAQHNFLGVVGADEKYIGLLSMEQLPTRVRRVLGSDTTPSDLLAVERVIGIRDLIDKQSPFLRLDDSLEKALEYLQESICVAVLDESGKLHGLLFESAIVGLYKREIARSGIRQV